MGSESWGVMDAGKHLLGQFDAPSYVRRGLEVEVAWLDVLAKLKRERKQWFEPLGRRLGEIKARAGDWRRLVGDNDRAVAALGQLETMLPCRLRFPPSRAWVILMHRREFKRWCRDAEQFNTYWRATAAAANLNPVNQRREAYNRWYLLEKECAIGSARLAAQGFQPLAPLTTADILAHLPELPSPDGC